MSESRTSAGEIVGFAICAIAAAFFYFIPPIAYYNRFLLQNFDYGILYQSTALLARIEPPYLWNIGRHAWADDQDYLQLFLTPFHLLSSPHYWLLTLHPLASGRVYAAYGGVYVAVALVWLAPGATLRITLAPSPTRAPSPISIPESRLAAPPT